MRRQLATLAMLSVLVAVPVPWSTSAPTRRGTSTLVFDAVGRGSFVDHPPAGPSPGDTEYFRARLRDATGWLVGTARSTCVFTKVILNDVLERCSASGKTRDGMLSFGGVGHLESMNPPWRVAGGTGAYKGASGKLIFSADIALDPNVPLAAGRFFNVAVFKLTTHRPLGVGIVARPAANATFVRRANTACRAAEAKGARLPRFPFPNFDPFHPEKKLLPKVGRFFDQPARRRLPRALLAELQNLGQPRASVKAWRRVLRSRQAALATETRQIRAALADNAPAFVRTVFNRRGITTGSCSPQPCSASNPARLISGRGRPPPGLPRGVR
jgi:hypothetical protein